MGFTSKKSSTELNPKLSNHHSVYVHMMETVPNGRFLSSEEDIIPSFVYTFLRDADE